MTKTVLLTVVYGVVPVILYTQFRLAYEESQKLLLRSVRDEGRAISESLLPWLSTAGSSALPELGQHLARFAGRARSSRA
jgi:hypothetical protein